VANNYPRSSLSSLYGITTVVEVHTRAGSTSLMIGKQKNRSLDLPPKLRNGPTFYRATRATGILRLSLAVRVLSALTGAGVAKLQQDLHQSDSVTEPFSQLSWWVQRERLFSSSNEHPFRLASLGLFYFVPRGHLRHYLSHYEILTA
jgi:hypothetical protein